jgi:hypothetical protein
MAPQKQTLAKSYQDVVDRLWRFHIDPVAGVRHDQCAGLGRIAAICAAMAWKSGKSYSPTRTNTGMVSAWSRRAAGKLMPCSGLAFWLQASPATPSLRRPIGS